MLDISDLVLSIHRRNGGSLNHLDWNLPLLAPQLLLDSLDLAEIMVVVEKETGCSPFDSNPVPQTWLDMREFVHAATK